MFSIRTILLLSVIWSDVMAHEEIRLCPACMDHKYSVFFRNNGIAFPESYRNYARRQGLEQNRCLENSYDTVRCDNACVRMHLKLTKRNKTETIGWMFDCSTDVVKQVPPTVENVPRDLSHFTGNLNFVDQLNTMGDLLVFFEIQFYNVSQEVEIAQQYYRRQHDEKKQIEDEKECRDYPTVCFLQKTLTRQNVLIGLGGFVFFLCFVCLIRYVCSSKNQNIDEESVGSATFTRFDEHIDDIISLEKMDETEVVIPSESEV